LAFTITITRIVASPLGFGGGRPAARLLQGRGKRAQADKSNRILQRRLAKARVPPHLRPS
jgi:hypothetical protein